MVKRLSFLSAFLCSLLIFGNIPGSYAQNKRVSADQVEKLMGYYNAALDQVQKVNGASNDDFRAFVRFERNKLHSEARRVYLGDKNVIPESLNVEEFEKNLTVVFSKVYSDFQKIKVEYPSSVKEYSSVSTPRVLQTFNCDSACTNPDFSNGDLSGWYAAYADNYSIESPDNGAYIDISNETGALCTAGQQLAAFDNDVVTNIWDPGPNPTYQVMIMHGGYDPLIPTVPRVSPFGSSAYSARVGDSTYPHFGVGILQQTFKVTANNQNFTYQYAVLLENPAAHLTTTQPFFAAVVLDSVGDTIPNCGKYLVTAGLGTATKGWQSTVIPDPANGGGSTVTVFFRNWTSVFVSLKKYIGHCVTICFTVSDCGQGGHFGYAYVSTSCSPQSLLSSSPVFCGQKTINITGPKGGDYYKWTGPTNSIVGSDSGQVVTVDSAGTYQVVVTPVTGSACNDSLTITIPKGPGSPPIPSFTADTACAGRLTQFTNTSNPGPGSGVKFYWDFYNFGSYEDSTTNPTWRYITGAHFSVKLHEVNNGCGSDTIISVLVDSLILPSYATTAIAACIGSNVTFTNTSSGASKYLWNFGDVASGKADTSTLVGPSHKYTAAGTYTVDLIESQYHGCPNDTIEDPITVSSLIAPPAPIITGPDSLCNGSNVALQVSNIPASGAYEYEWYPSTSVSCPFCTSVVATPTITTTYTITFTNFTCPTDTTFTLKVNPIPVPVITTTPNDTICRLDSSLLKVNCAGCTYVWAPNNSTVDSIFVKPPTSATYTVQATSRGCSGSTTQQVIVIFPGGQGVILSVDSICPGASTTMTASGGTRYEWLLPLSSVNPTVTISPTSSHTYSVVVMSACTRNDTVSQTVHVVQHPPIKYTGNTTICDGKATTLSATGGTNYQWFDGTIRTDASSIILSPNINASYTLTADSGNCPTDSVITIKVNPIPVVTVSPSNSICIGQSITLTATGGGTYLWSNNSVDSVIKVSPIIATKYTVIVTNSYLCVDSASTTVVVKSPHLDVCCDTTIKYGSSVILSTSYSANYAWLPVTGLTCTNCPTPAASPTLSTTYTISVTDTNGCPIKDTVRVNIESKCADFVVPNVFSPNNDGIDDDFVIKVYNTSVYSITIYDRWGKQVFASSDPGEYWDGRTNNTNNLVADGTYYYIINATCDTHYYVKHGFVEVVGENK